MNCPKCGKELLQVNGKYVCVDCGIEVPESGSPASGDSTIPADQPAQAQMTTSAVDATSEPAPTPPAPEAPDTPKSDMPEPDVAGQPASSEAMTDLQSQPEQPADIPTSSGVSVEEALKNEEDAAKEEVTPEKAAEAPTPEMPQSQPVTSDAPTVPETPPHDPFDAAEQKAEMPTPPTQEAPPTPQATEAAPTPPQPVDTPITSQPANDTNITPPPQAPPVQADPAIFQDPMYDSSNAGQGTDVPSGVETEEKENKKVTVILVIGIVIAILLAVGGFIAYKILT